MDDDAIIYISLKEVADASAGYPLRGSADALSAGDVRLIQLKNTDLQMGVNWNEVAMVSLPSKRDPAWLLDGDILFASRGTRTLAYPLSNVPPRAVCAPQFFVLTVRKPDQISPQFLAWQINQKPAQEYLQRNATGSHIQNIRRGILEELPLAIPSMEKQLMIVNLWHAAQREQVLLQRLAQIRNIQLEALALGLAYKRPEA